MFAPLVESWKPIVVGVDASPEAAIAAAAGVRIARQAVVSCHLVHASPTLEDSLPLVPNTARLEDLRTALRDATRQDVSAALAASVPPAVLSHLTVRAGRAPVVLEQLVAELDAGLVVLGGKHHSALGRWLGSSTVHNLVRRLSVPVLVTRSRATIGRRVLVAVDLSEAARPTIEAAERVARLFDAKLRVLYVVEPIPIPPEPVVPYDPRAYEALQVEQFKRDVWSLVTLPNAQQDIRYGPVAAAIAATADDWEADLLVLGSHGKGWVDRLLIGSVTERVLNHLPTATLVIPATPGATRAAASASTSRAAWLAPV